MKTVGAPGPAARITMIWWRLLTCRAARLTVAPPGKPFSADVGESAWECCPANPDRREMLREHRAPRAVQ